MMTAAAGLQVAIFDRLTAELAADPAVPVFDAVPPETPFPYVVVGRDTWTENGTKTDPAADVLVEINIYDENHGLYPVKQIQGRVHEALDGFLPSPGGGWETIFTRWESEETFTDPDNPTIQRGVSRFRLRLSK